MDLPGILRAGAAEHPRHIAYSCAGEQITLGEFDRRVDRAANALTGAGVRSGDRVAILDKNSLEYAELLFAAARMGAVLVPVNYRLAPDEVAYIVNDAKAAALVVGPEFTPVLDALADRLDHTRLTLTIGAGYAEWRDAAPDKPVDAPGEVFVQLYSSGTTGLPKGVMLTHDNFLAALPGIFDLWDLGPHSVLMVAMPMYHIAGCALTVCAIYAGVPGVIVREPDPAVIVAELARHHVTHVFLVPVILLMMQHLPDVGDLSHLRLLLYGASPISDDVPRGAMRLLPATRFMQVYGLTETTGAITFLPPEDHVPDSPRLRSAGLPGPGVELAIVEPVSGDPLPPGAVGEVACRTAQNMPGYWARDSSGTLTGDGWLRTGDTGHLDSDGYLFISDRVKDMIISGGENIYPAEVENALMGHPAVADCAVIGVPDRKWGETPKALVVRDGDLTDADLIAYCRAHLAHYKCPTSVEWLDAIPRNPTGKILKRQLREPYWKGQDRAV